MEEKWAKSKEKEKSPMGFKDGVFLVVLGVVLFVALSNIKVVADSLWLIVGLFTPLIVGGAMAFILNVPMHFFERLIDKLSAGHPYERILKKIKPAMALIVTLVLFVIVVIIISNVIFPNLVESVVTISNIVMDSYPDWLEFFESKGIDTTFIGEKIAELDFNKIVAGIKENGVQIFNTASAAATSVFGVLTNGLFGIIFAIYILLNKKKLGIQAKQLAYAYLKKPWADEICEVSSLSYKIFAGFLSGQCLEAVILGTMFVVTLLVGGFPYAVTIGVIIGTMSIIPFVGAFIGLAFGVLLISAVSLEKALWFVVVFFVVQQIEGQIIYPKVVGGSVGLPALWTLLAVVVGGNVSGIFGIIVFIPLFSVIYALLRRNVYSRLNKKQIKISND